VPPWPEDLEPSHCSDSSIMPLVKGTNDLIAAPRPAGQQAETRSQTPTITLNSSTPTSHSAFQFLRGILEQRCPSLSRPLREAPRAQEIVGKMAVLPRSMTRERNLFPDSMSPRNYFSPRASRNERWRPFRRCSYWLARRLAGAESESRGWWPRLELGISFELNGSTAGSSRGCEFWECGAIVEEELCYM